MAEVIILISVWNDNLSMYGEIFCKRSNNQGKPVHIRKAIKLNNTDLINFSMAKYLFHKVKVDYIKCLDCLSFDWETYFDDDIYLFYESNKDFFNFIKNYTKNNCLKEKIKLHEFVLNSICEND